MTKLWGQSAARASAAERLLARGLDQPMVVECGQALAAAGEYPRAAEVLVSVASNLSTPRSVRGTAYVLLMHVVGRDLGEWERVAELLDDWEKAMPGDERIALGESRSPPTAEGRCPRALPSPTANVRLPRAGRACRLRQCDRNGSSCG